MARDGDEYADPMMKIAILSTEVDGEAGVEAVEKEAETLYEGNFTSIPTDHSEIDWTENKFYNLVFDEASWLTIFPITFPSPGYYAFFCEHFLSEFHNEDVTDSVLTNDKSTPIDFSWTSADEGNDPKRCFLFSIVHPAEPHVRVRPALGALSRKRSFSAYQSEFRSAQCSRSDATIRNATSSGELTAALNL